MFERLGTDGWLRSPEGEAGETGGSSGENTGGEDRHTKGILADLTRTRQANAELRSQLEALQAAETDRQAAAKAAEEEAAAKRGEFEKLYGDSQAELAKLRDENSKYQAAEQARIKALTAKNSERIALLPEGFAVPDGLSPEQTGAVLDTLERAVKASGDKVNPVLGRTGGQGAPSADELTDAERRWVDDTERGRKYRGATPATIRKAFNKFGPGKNKDK